jgi:acyl-coenzyme A thioesterase PaaI-like protein
MNMRFLSPVRGRVFAHARVLKVGRSLCPIVADVVDEAGRLVGHAGMTYMRLGSERAADRSPHPHPTPDPGGAP